MILEYALNIENIFFSEISIFYQIKLNKKIKKISDLYLVIEKIFPSKYPDLLCYMVKKIKNYSFRDIELVINEKYIDNIKNITRSSFDENINYKEDAEEKLKNGLHEFFYNFFEKNKNLIAEEEKMLLEKVILKTDLSDSEYEKLGNGLRKKPELLKELSFFLE